MIVRLTSSANAVFCGLALAIAPMNGKAKADAETDQREDDVKRDDDGVEVDGERDAGMSSPPGER